MSLAYNLPSFIGIIATAAAAAYLGFHATTFVATVLDSERDEPMHPTYDYIYQTYLKSTCVVSNQNHYNEPLKCYAKLFDGMTFPQRDASGALAMPSHKMFATKTVEDYDPAWLSKTCVSLYKDANLYGDRDRNNAACFGSILERSHTAYRAAWQATQELPTVTAATPTRSAKGGKKTGKNPHEHLKEAGQIYDTLLGLRPRVNGTFNWTEPIAIGERKTTFAALAQHELPRILNAYGVKSQPKR